MQRIVVDVLAGTVKVVPMTQEDVAALPPPPPPVFPALTARQLRLGLLALGVTRAQVEALIAAIPDDTAREATLIEWEYATTYDRAHPLVAQIGAALRLAEQDLDAAWIAAASL